jgi:membrane AbrB-like protein
MLDVAILTACAVAGVYLGGWLRLPAAQLVGPMILSAIVHIAGLTHSAPPPVLVIVAQVVLGTVLGCRFVGAPKPMVVRSLALSLGATLLTLTVTLVFAVLFHGLFGQTAEQVILAYAPGGLTEMSLVALSMNAEVAYISVHHLARIALVIAFAPIVMKWLLRRS